MSGKMPLVDLKAEWAAIADEALPAMKRVCESGAFILGPEVEAFEREFAGACGTEWAVGVASGTDALRLGLQAMDVTVGDEVVVPAMTFFATASAVVQAGAVPVFADVDPATGLIDAADVARRLSPRTRAILPVHLYGQPADLDALARFGRPVIEDACQAHGATYRGRRVGSVGAFAAFSFYPAKNLGAAGDAGLLVTNSAEIARKAKALRNYGQTERYRHERMGTNSRLDSLQAALLRIKLRRLAENNAARGRAAARYGELLRGLAVERPAVLPDRTHAFHLYVVRSEERERIRQQLSDAGIETGIHYPVPLHLQPAFKYLGHREGDFPGAEAIARTALSLPMHPYLSEADQRRVAEAIASALRKDRVGS